jgi:hypothetical protein
MLIFAVPSCMPRESHPSAILPNEQRRQQEEPLNPQIATLGCPALPRLIQRRWFLFIDLLVARWSVGIYNDQHYNFRKNTCDDKERQNRCLHGGRQLSWVAIIAVGCEIVIR